MENLNSLRAVYKIPKMTEKIELNLKIGQGLPGSFLRLLLQEGVILGER